MATVVLTSAVVSRASVEARLAAPGAEFANVVSMKLVVSADAM